METPTKEAPKVKQVAALNPSRWSLREHSSQDHFVTVPLGTAVEDLLHPDFWAHVAPHLTQYDRVCAVPDDGTWYMELLVVACNVNSAKLEVLKHLSLDESITSGDTPIIPPAYEVKFRGKHLKWCVIRKEDGAVLRTGMKRDDAFGWLTDYLKTVSKVPA